MRPTLRRLLISGILLLLLHWAAPAAQPATRPAMPVPRVVILHSLSADDEWTRQMTEGAVSALSEGAGGAEIFIEFMDAVGKFGAPGGETFKNLMEAKYASLPPALVIAAGNEAFNFAAGRGNPAFKGASLIFCGLDRELFHHLIKDAPMTGIYSTSPHALLLSEIERIHPGAPILFVSRSSPTGIRDFSRFSAGALKIEEGIKLMSAPDYSDETLKDLLDGLPPNGVIILGSHPSATEEGRRMTGDLVSFVSGNSPLPVYTLDECGVLYGAAGSLHWNGFEMGKRAGEMAAEFLSGKPMGDISPEFSINYRMAFDYGQMKRRSIPLSSLAEDSLLLNDPLEIVGRFLPTVLAYSGISVLLFILAFFLRGRINTRKKAEKELAKRTENWKQLFQNSPEGIIVYDESGMILETNHTFRSIFALSEKELLEGARIQTLLPWDRGGLRPEDFFPAGKTAPREAAIADRDGALVHGTHLPFLIAAEPQKVYCSLIEDISERKRMSELLRHKSRYQQSLSSISIRFLLGPDYGETMELSLREILAFSGAESGAIFRYSEKNGLLVPESEVLSRPESPSLIDLFPSAPEETILWEASILRDGGVKPVTFSLDRHMVMGRSPWRRLAARGASFVSIMPLTGMNEILGILVLADPDESWKYEGLETAFNFLGNSLATAMEQHRDKISLENNRRVISERFAGIITALCQVSELRDVTTSGHQKKVSALAENIAGRLGLSGEALSAVRYSGLLHDIGKLYIPAEILSKPSALTQAEYDLVKKHPEYGRDILSPLDFPWPLAKIILQHHERIDGSGYPDGLRKDEISIEARILAVADSFDAMTSDRPYREKMSTSRAMAEIRFLSGRAYDPDVVRALESYLESGPA